MGCFRGMKGSLAGAWLLGFLLIGCGISDEESRYGDWTVAEDSLRLTEELRVSETETFYFGGIADVAVNENGKIAVADYKAGNVKVLSPDGSVAHILGEKGEGPGEFQQVGFVQWARGDSLYAYDLEASRLTVFSPDPPYPRERTVSVSREDGMPVRVRVVGQSLTVEISRQVPPSDGSMRFRRVRRLSESGVPKDTLFSMPRQGSVVVRSDGVFQFRPIPFGRESEIAVGPDNRLYAGWQDSLRVVAHGLNGGAEEIVDVTTPHIPMPQAARDSVLDQIDNPDLRQAAASAMPDTKSAFTDLIVADNGQLWVQRSTKTPKAATVPWWVLDPDTKTIHQLRLPRDVELSVVQDGRAYGITTMEAGAPALVRYHIDVGR